MIDISRSDIDLLGAIFIGFLIWRFWAKVDKKLPFWGKNWEIGKNREIFKKSEKRQYNHVSIIKIHILAKFHEKIMIFGEISGHLVILPIYRAQTRDS